MDKELKELDISALKVGDILWNIAWGDVWLVTVKWSDKVRVTLIHGEYQQEEDIESVDFFKKVGNVYDVARKFLRDEYLAEQQ